MTRRSKAREVVLQMLYQIDVNPDVGPAAVREMIREQLPDEDLQTFAWSLFAGVRENRPRLDAGISAAAENWTLARMAPTDRNALRLGAYELLFTDMPLRVVLDETIELARRFGTAQSPQFVNGILDKLVPAEKRKLEESSAPPSEPPPGDS